MPQKCVAFGTQPFALLAQPRTLVRRRFGRLLLPVGFGHQAWTLVEPGRKRGEAVRARPSLGRLGLQTRVRLLVCKKPDSR